MNKDKKMVEKASYFASICYAPWFMKSYLSQKVSANDWGAFSKSYWNLNQSLILVMQRYAWHLTQELVLFSLADDNIED